MNILDGLFPDRAPGAESLFCRVGMHRWLGPGAWCEQCGYPDVIFDLPEMARRRLDEWRATR